MQMKIDMSDTDSCQEKLAIVLPSLDPDDKFDRVVEELSGRGFSAIVIVDDGTCAEGQKHFEKAESLPGCVVLHHEVNRGKGQALKTAFSYVLEQLPRAEGVITIDGDGQHLPEDILACGQRMLREKDKVILGCRDFDQPGVPSRNAGGNKFTSRLFRVMYGVRLSDTQTGLRAIPRAYLETFLRTEGDRFEYEMNMLLEMKRKGIVFLEQPITTVYDPESYSSHYHPVKDSLRIFRVMVKGLFH